MPFRFLLGVRAHDLNGDLDLGFSAFPRWAKLFPVVGDDRWALAGLAEEMRKAEGQAAMSGQLGRVDARPE